MSTVTTFIARQSEFQTVLGRMHYAYNTLDFAVTNVASADVVQALKIPANAFVTNVFVVVRTAEGATCTATVGDGDTANGWDASTDFNATANTETAGLAGTDTFATAGKFYAAADTIDFTMNNAAATGKVTIGAIYFMVDA